MSDHDPSQPAGSVPPNPPQWMAYAPPPAVPPQRNGFAVASLILGILGICGFSLVLGLIFGIIALVQINKHNQTGRGMAIGGIVLSVLWIFALTIGLIVFSDRLLVGGTAPTALGLKTGECYVKQVKMDADITKASCTTPHDGEVFATFPLKPSTESPTDDELEQAAKAGCSTRADEYFPPGLFQPSDWELATFHPDKAAWQAGKHNAVCAFQAQKAQFTGPIGS
jgi:hypothetical protein